MISDKKAWEFIPSASSLSSIHFVGEGNFEFVNIDKSLTLRIRPPMESDLRLEIQLERQLIEATEAYLNLMDGPTTAALLDRAEAARAALLKLQIKLDLCRRVNAKLKKYILSSDRIFNHIDNSGNALAAVLVMDIRKSTSMMLKTTDRDFAKYLNTLMTSLVSAITDRYGIFEKFTGDGFIALYIKSITEDAVIRAVSTAFDCIEIFENHRRNSDSAFSAILSDFGLSFGIDYGYINLNMISNEINVIGKPVVYASRMAGGKSNDIMLNYQAKLELENIQSNVVKLRQTRVKIKNEADHDGWRVINDTRNLPLNEPNLDLS
jgi:class 3 adenylate cyclase